MNIVSNKKTWQRSLISPTEEIGKAIKKLDTSAMQILLVVDEARNLLGTITDGDVRRALLNGFRFQDCVKDIMHQKPVIVSEKTDLPRTLELMRSHKLRQLPITNNIGSVVGLHVWDELISVPKRNNF